MTKKFIGTLIIGTLAFLLIASRYFGGIKFDETMNRLSRMMNEAAAAGATSWGTGAQNAVTVWLNPYSGEQKAIFNDFLLANDFDPAHFIIEPAISPEMYDRRANQIAQATSNPATLIVDIGETEVSRMEIFFTLQNTTDYTFFYGAPWDLAVYENGNWRPMAHLPGRGCGIWPLPLFFLESGEIQQYRQSFGWHFGALPPGRYAFIRDGWLGDWDDMHRDLEYIFFAVVIFEVMDDTPMNLAP